MGVDTLDSARRPLAGQVALVTGSVRRIGRATALALAGAGADVVINARSSRDEAEATAREVEALGVRAMVHLADVTDEAAVGAMTDAVVERFGRLDILVNNAAIRREGAFTEMPLAEWREIMSVVLDGAFLCARAAIPHMKRQGGGRIVNIGGVSAHTGAIERAHVATAKMGLVGLTHALAVEFAPTGITVNCIAPGKIGGKRSATSGAGVALPNGGRPLVSREGTVDDVAAVILTVCGPAGGFITGQTIHVNGGLYLT
ncbi:SDR family oxidoreductase [Mongoliimonas terrestris]|uniref:SDR family oxidoreductase n=1 Tax=Mongoliimonas terrestris TaxID=1709001 RepID=UPI000949708D|nr:SDR family oxidoreductase [Mongoliimonas terrestris]